ncbi:MAG: sulfatase [Cytophagales bacterium]|nr:sulfatase [Cytophagales bacterium]
MNRSYFMLLTMLTGFVGLSGAQGIQKNNISKPNIIILFTDDQGYGDVGAYGSTNIETPHLDRMAEEGMRFTNFYVAASSCTPSRAALLTGCYPQRVGLPAVVNDQSDKGLSASEFTIASYLKQNGYSTGMFGKWHLGHHPEFMPTRHGFTEFYGIPYSMDMWPWHPKPSHPYPALPLYDREEVVEYNPDVNQMTAVFTEKAVDFIKRNKDNPFMLYVPYSQPHVPLGVSDKFKGKSKAGRYGDVIMEIDWSVGEIMKTVKELGISNRTLILFTSDNGPWLTYGNHAGSTGGLREGKGTVFGGGQKVPFIAWMEGSVPAGKVEDRMVSALDILPTVVSVTKSNMPRVNPVDGRDIWPILTGRGDVESKPFFFVKTDEVQGVRKGKWKLHVPHKYRVVLSKGADGLPGEQDNFGGSIGLSLYNIDKDPAESKNVASKYPKVVAQLQKLIKEFESDLAENSRPAGIAE